MPNYFKNSDHIVSLQPLTTIANTGFRPGQLGALHSILAHFSINNDPAVVCLPTGYGKTAVMMALPFVLRAERILVVEPSDPLRRQTTDHFKTLSTLRRLHVVPQHIPDPQVHGQKGRPSALEWQDLTLRDVVISTPQSTSPVLAPGAPHDLFDLIIFDEAHHGPADTWSAYVNHFTNARFVFLTATPFRRDKKAIPGKLVYWYPVLKAAHEKAFGKVHFVPAPVSHDLNEDETDRSVARVAARQLASDRDAGFDHRLFVRAASIKSARALLPVYMAEGLKVKAIDSDISKRKQDEYEAQLQSGELDGVICVDMFGEGYDFPKLKIAALHAPHRSLVPTLQFIGRFARTDEATGDATLIAPVGRLREATLKLFQEGIEISELIDTAAREQLAELEADLKILEILKTKRQAESDYDDVSPLSLVLYAHTRIFECSGPPDFMLFGPTLPGHLKLAKQWMSDDGLMTMLLTVDHAPPAFATTEVLVNVRHDAFVFRYIPNSGLCYIGSTRRTERLYLDFMQIVCKDRHRPLSYQKTRRAIAGLKNLHFYNVGLKNTAINTQAESYRVLTGPKAERAVTAGDGRAFVQGHFLGSGVINDKRETVGVSSGSRIWSNRRLSVADYLDWIEVLDARLGGVGHIAESQLDLVHHPKQLTKLPDKVIVACWNKTAYRAAPLVRVRHASWDNYEQTQLTDIELSDFESNHIKHELIFLIKTETFSVPYRFSTDGGPLFAKLSTEWQLEVLTGTDDWTEMETWLSINPPVFYASDRSSFQGMNLMQRPSTTAVALGANDTATLDWKGCAIQIEFEAHKADGQATIHQHLESHLRTLDGLQVLIYDHRTGEAADFICVCINEQDECLVSLYHCKGAGGKPSGARVNDVYEVAGQVIKSIGYCEMAVLIKHVEQRINAQRYAHPSQFYVGNMEQFKACLQNTPANKLRFEIYAVQPGISRRAIDSHLADLMAFGIEYAHRGGAAKAKWLISE